MTILRQIWRATGCRFGRRCTFSGDFGTVGRRFRKSRPDSALLDADLAILGRVRRGSAQIRRFLRRSDGIPAQNRRFSSRSGALPAQIRGFLDRFGALANLLCRILHNSAQIWRFSFGFGAVQRRFADSQADLARFGRKFVDSQADSGRFRRRFGHCRADPARFGRRFGDSRADLALQMLFVRDFPWISQIFDRGLRARTNFPVDSSDFRAVKAQLRDS